MNSKKVYLVINILVKFIYVVLSFYNSLYNSHTASFVRANRAR